MIKALIQLPLVLIENCDRKFCSRFGEPSGNGSTLVVETDQFPQ